MRKFLLAIFALVLLGKVVSGQNVMSHLDVPQIYDTLSPIGSPKNPAFPSFGTMIKWVYDTSQKVSRVNSGINWNPVTNPFKNFRIPWNQSRFKAYFFNGMAFRLRFPKNYDPSGATKYPLILFMHGAGEAAPLQTVLQLTNSPATYRFHSPNIVTNHENQDQLFWGAQTFDLRIENNEWNGFLLFPQQEYDQRSGWDNSMFEPINQVLDTLQKYHKFDQDRVTVMGLSSGGGGNIAYASAYPKRVAVVATSDPAFGVSDSAAIVHIPIWIANGGQDRRPSPNQVHDFINKVRDLGGDTYQNYYATGGHFSWNTMWAQQDINGRTILTDYWNRAHKAQPLLFFQKDKFCADQPISAKMGLTPGFNAYEWQKNTGTGFVTISGAGSNEYTATQIGSYRARFKATASAPWSDWSPNPIVLSLKPCATDTLFVEHFDHYGVAPTYLYDGPSWGYKNYNYFRQSGLFVPGSESFTQDATGRQGGRFLFNHTYPQYNIGDPLPYTGFSAGAAETTPYAPGDKVWRYDPTIPVQFNTNYIFSFWVGNITNINPHVQIVAKINDVALIPSNVTPSTVLNGNRSWTKYSYIWNSGFNGNALPELLNNTIPAAGGGAGNGNDFVIDEISFTKLLAPGGVGTGMVLWAKPENLTGTPASGIANWPNAAGNGKDLVQTTQANKPTLSYEDTDRINFNPVASLTNAGNDFFTSNGSYTGTTAHNAAHIYVVAKSNSNTAPAGNYFIQENLSVGTDKVEINLPNGIGRVRWAAGNLATNNLETPFLAADVNKPLLWSFSKSNTGTTGSGNKQDIRKNGSVIISNNVAGSFTGAGANLKMGAFDGRVAEVIYYLDADATINNAAQNKIESYLALKYGITLTGTTNYTASNNTIFWTGNATYQNDVFGIGRDNASGLNQTVSNSMNTGSGTGIGQSAKGNLVVQTTTPLADNKFLVMGNDAALLTEQLTDLPGFALGAKRVSREWKVNNTGAVGPVNISFDIAGLTVSGGSTTGNYSILIDNDGDGNFTTGTQSFKNASSIDGSKINFTGVTLNNNVVFTFVTQAPAARPLPATWLSFTVETDGSNAALSWKTADEVNVNNYVVEHSTNSIDYAEVGTVSANNTSGVNAYNFEHNGLAEGTHYYRIRRVDFDSKFGYSIVKTVKIAKKGANVEIRPNPVTGKTLLLGITTQQSTRAAISVINVEGKTMVQQNTALAAGTNRVNINLGVIADGVYMLRVQMGEEVVTQKFVKTH
jgi:predicted esterase